MRTPLLGFLASTAFLMMTVTRPSYASDTKVDLSTASRAEIVAAFPKVGTSVIDDVLELREKKGPCRDIVDLAATVPESTFAFAVMIGKGAYCSGKGGSTSANTASQPRAASSSPSASPSAATAAADAAHPSYSKLNTAAGWIEFLSSGPSREYAQKGRSALAVLVGGDAKSTTRFSGLALVECKAGTLTMDEVLEHSSTLGSKWKYYCEKGTVTYTVFNPTSETLFIRGSAYGVPIDSFLGAGKSLTGSAAMKSSCSTSGEPRYEPGKIIWPCIAPKSLLKAVDPVDRELTEFPDILKSTDLAHFRELVSRYPDGLLAEYASDRMKDLEEKHYLDLEEAITLRTAVGPAPAKLIDPTPYTLTVGNPSNEALIVMLVTRTDALVSGAEAAPCRSRTNVTGGMNSETMALIKKKVGEYSGSKCMVAQVEPGGEATLSLRSAPSAQPNVVILWVGAGGP